jgi:Na+/H+ antiporter NhaD/arsenite permease-like protein
MIAEHEDPRRAFARVDWPLLVFFCSLFVVVRGLVSTGLVQATWAAAAPYVHLASPGGVTAFSALMTVGSNVVSNVPMTLLSGPYLPALGPERFGWILLGFTTTVAGNLTILGSVANIIVAETARDDYRLGYFEYLRFGFVSTILSLAAGVPLLWLTAG